MRKKTIQTLVAITMVVLVVASVGVVPAARAAVISSTATDGGIFSTTGGATGGTFGAGTHSNTTVYGLSGTSGASVGLAIDAGSGANGALDLSSACTGTGISGAYPNCIIDTTSFPAGFNYTTVTIPATPSYVTLTATGAYPLIIKATGNVTIAGTLSANGNNGVAGTVAGCPILGGPGGSNGGGRRSSGCGTGAGGVGGFDYDSCSEASGGGGFGGQGGTGTNNGACPASPGAGGWPYGNATNGGSGGGGGQFFRNASGNYDSGGGGGGSISIISRGNILINGIINANGGNASSGATGMAGGGSGGGIALRANSITNNGSVRASGGNGAEGGGGGGGGRISLNDDDNIIAGTGTPTLVSHNTTATVSGSGGTGASNGIVSIGDPLFVFISPGTFTSAPIDLGAQSDLTTLGWTTSQPSSATSIIFDTRSGAIGATCADATWNTWNTGIATVTTANATGSSTIPSPDGRCFQYRATFAAGTATTLSLNDVTVNYLTGALNFSATITPQNEAVMKGGSLNVSPGITATLTYGASAPNPVTFSVNPVNLPAGVSVSFTNSPCSPTLTAATPTCTSSFVVTTSGATPPGAFVIPIKASIIVGAGNTVTKEATYAFTVTEMFDFEMAWTGALSGAVTQGGNITSAFSVTQTAGAESESVSFDSASSGSGVSTYFSLDSCFPTCSPNVTADFRTVFAGGAGDTPIGPQTITIVGISASGITKSIEFDLTVNAGFNFSMTLNNNSGGAFAGGAASPLPTITTKYESGSPGTVSYAITNLDPTNITVTPSTLGNCSFTIIGQTCDHGPLAISASLTTTPGTYSIQIAGTSSTGLVRYATYVLTVYPPFDFTMKFEPGTGNFNATTDPQDFSLGTIYQGESLSSMLIITYNSPLPQTVNFSHTVIPSSSDVAASYTSSCTETCIIPVFFSANEPAEGEYTITLTGTGGGKTHFISYTLTVLVPPFDYNMRGWAFSDGAGWISFSSRNCDIDWDGVMDRIPTGQGDGDATADAQCPVDGTIIPNYGGHLDPSSYELSGWAWSEHIGWITFDKTITGTPPQAPYNDAGQSYIARLEDGTVKGWARAISCPDAECDTDSDWGWIKMSGTAVNGNSYGVRNAASDFIGFAWGGHAIGWISFNSQNCDTDNDGMWDACGLSGNSYRYRVYAIVTIPNAPPLCVQDGTIDLESNFINRCVAPFAPQLTCMYQDNEGDPLEQYTIKIYDQSCDTDKNQLIDAGVSCMDISDSMVIGDNVTTILKPLFEETVDTDPASYDPGPSPDMIPVEYSYLGTALDYNGTYYFTMEVRDEAHLN